MQSRACGRRVTLLICDRSGPLRCGRLAAVAHRAAFVHPTIDLAPKVVGEQRRFHRFATGIRHIENSGLLILCAADPLASKIDVSWFTFALAHGHGAGPGNRDGARRSYVVGAHLLLFSQTDGFRSMTAADHHRQIQSTSDEASNHVPFSCSCRPSISCIIEEGAYSPAQAASLCRFAKVKSGEVNFTPRSIPSRAAAI